MDKIQMEKVNQSREYLVVKSNDLVLQTRYNYTVYEQRTLAYICSMIKPLTTDFDILEYARVCGIDNNGNLYTRTKKVLKKLSDNSMWLRLPNGSETLVRWISKVTLNNKNGLVHIRLDEDLTPYLFELQSRYLSYPYEWIIDIDELKRKLMVDNIKSYTKDNSLFRIKVLEPAHREINEFSDISFDFEMLKRGRSCYAVKFTIIYKNLIERSKVDVKISELLGEPK